MAVVGISSQEDRPSHRVARYLKEHGYRIISVNPREREVLGEKCYPDLCAVPELVEVVDIFRRPQHVPKVVAEAMYAGAKGCLDAGGYRARGGGAAGPGRWGWRW